MAICLLASLGTNKGGSRAKTIASLYLRQLERIEALLINTGAEFKRGIPTRFAKKKTSLVA